jgi:hypothetical protein
MKDWKTSIKKREEADRHREDSTLQPMVSP